MCHNSIVENEQIEKCIQNGMPTKLIKTLKYTMRKRAANEESNHMQRQQQTNLEQNRDDNNKVSENIQMSVKNSNLFISKCPFGHGKFPTPPPPTTKSYFSQTTSSSSSSSSNNATTTSNNNNTNNNLYEQFPQLDAITSGHLNVAVADAAEAKRLLSMRQHYNEDILAKSTRLTREFAHKMQQAMRKFQSSKIYTVLTQTTQPTHLVAISVVAFVLLTIWPELIDGSVNNGSSQQQQHPQMLTTSMPNHRHEMSVRKNEMLALLAYLGAFSAHFGAQIWMTFVSGLSLYFSLPRHMFGQCQQILFPKYFAMNAALSIIMLIIYVKCFLDTWTLANCIQLGSLALTGLIELTVRLYLAPPLLHLMHEKYKIEDTVGSGKEIGSLVQGDLVNCPHYQRIHKAFRRIHMTVAMGNMFTMVSSCLQLHYLAGQLQISLVH